MRLDRDGAWRNHAELYAKAKYYLLTLLELPLIEVGNAVRADCYSIGKQNKEHKIALEKDIESALVSKQAVSLLKAVKKSLREIGRKPRVYPK